MNTPQYPEGYPVPGKNVLLISCIDLRLIDDLVRFMDRDNLTNRYDHVTLAGCSLGVSLPDLEDWHNAEHDPCNGRYGPASMALGAWWAMLKNHIQIAIDLHDIHDIYIVEHEACGAYRVFVNEATMAKNTEAGCQSESSKHLQEKIEKDAWINSCATGDTKKQPLRIQRFRMDLRGHVRILD